MITKTLQVKPMSHSLHLVGEGPQQVPGSVHSSKGREEVQQVRLENLHVEEEVAAAVESEHRVGFLVEDHTGRAAAAAAVNVVVG